MSVEENKYGIGGARVNEIHSALFKGDPRSVIPVFQQENTLTHPNANDILNFSDVLDIRRSTAYAAVMDCVADKLMEKIPTLDEETLKKLLHESFQYIMVEPLQKIAVQALSHTKQIPDVYLESLSNKRQLLPDLPISIQRKVWEHKPDIFHAKLLPLVEKYIEDAKLLKFIVDLHLFQSVSTTKRRAEDAALKEIIRLIGPSVVLYQHTISCIIEKYAKTGKPGYCVLRSDLILMQTEVKNQDILSRDRCRKYAQCLDSFINEGNFQDSHFEELRSIVKTIPREADNISNMAMLAGHPFVISVVIKSILHKIRGLIHNDQLPRHNAVLEYMSNLLYLGLRSKHVVEKKLNKIPKVPKDLVRVFYPLFTIMVIEDVNEEVEEVESQIKEAFVNDDIPRKILMYYLIQKVRNRQFLRSSYVVEMMLDTDLSKIGKDMGFLRSYTKVLLQMIKTIREQDDFNNKLLEPVFRCAPYSSEAHFQSLRLLKSYERGRILSKSKVAHYLKLLSDGIKIGEHAADIRMLYEDFKTRYPDCFDDMEIM